VALCEKDRDELWLADCDWVPVIVRVCVTLWEGVEVSVWLGVGLHTAL
jgi:hypothetical protein